MPGRILHHFSEDPGIERFEPRAVVAARPPGREWLNGPVVWAIDSWHQPMYLFPRDCPRILSWLVTADASAEVRRWMGPARPRMVALIEESWRARFEQATLHRYRLPGQSFEDLHDAGMFVSRTTVEPLGVDMFTPLPQLLAAEGAEVRVVPSLVPFRGLHELPGLHVSGIRLRNAAGWKT